MSFVRSPMIASMATSLLRTTKPVAFSRCVLGNISKGRTTVTRAPNGRHLSTAAAPDSRFKQLTDADLQFLRDATAPTSVLTDPDDVSPFNADWMGKYKGRTAAVVLPNSTNQVSDVLKYCNEQNIAVVPQGGNTGLVGGSIPVHDEVVISLTRMSEIVALDEVSGILTVQAGCVLETANLWLNERGFIMPYDLGAKGTCTVGGNVATNAGGLQLVRYGSLRSKVVGLEVVLANGTVLDMQSHCRKDNTGYPLKELFVGSEGSLGVITSVVLEVPIKPKVKNLMLLGVDSYETAQKVLMKARRDYCGEIISSCEYWDRQCMELVLDVFPALRDPLATPCPFYLLIETAGSDADHDYAKLEALMEYAFGDDSEQAEVAESESESAGVGSGRVMEGILAQDEAQSNALWAIREGIPMAFKDGGGAIYKYDISLPIHAMDKTVQTMVAHLKGLGIWESHNVKAFQYGHIGDGNVHLTFMTSKIDQTVVNGIEPFIYEEVGRQHGSISAEHGIGQLKLHALEQTKPPQVMQCMRQLKMAFDPKGILNPYKVISMP